MKNNIKKRMIYLLLIFITHIIIIGCSTSSTSKLPLTEEQFSPKTSNGKIKEYFSPPGRPYKTIGIVTAETPLFSYIPYAESYNIVKELLKDEAKKLGADGIMDIKIDQEESTFATVFKGQAKALKLIIEEKDEKSENGENGEKRELDDVDYSIRELLDTYEIVSSFKEVLEAIEKRPKNANNYILLGNIYSKKNEIDKAIEYYQRSIELRSDNPVAYRSLANSFRKKGQFEEAVRAFKNIIDIGQATIFDHYSLASLYIKRGKFEKAVSEFLNVSDFIQSGDKSDIYQEEDMKVALNMARKLLELRENIEDISAENIDDIWIVESIGYLSFLSRDYEDSVNYFEKAKTINQDLFEFYYENGYSYLNSIYPNKIFYGISNAKKAIKINPSSYSAHILLGQLYLLDNNPKDLVSGNDEAIKEFATAIELDNSKAEGYYYLGNALKNNGDYENALKVTKKALGIDPDYISAVEQEGDIYASTKLYNKALETYFDLYDRASKNKDSEKARIYEKIGAVYELKGEYENAISEYNKAYRLVLKNSEKVNIHKKIGGVYELKGEYKSAINEYNKAFKLTRKSSEKARIYEKIGAVYELKGEYENAISEYNKAYELTNFNKFIENIASAYRKEGYYEKAIDTMKRLIALDDSNPKYHFTLAYLYDEENRIEEAISEYNRVIRLNPQNTDALYNLGLAYINNKEKDRAIEQFGRYLEVTMNMPDKKEWRERAKGFIFNLEYPDMRVKFTDIGTITSLLSTELEYTRANHLFIAGALDTTPIHNSKNLTGYNVSPKIQEAKNIFRNVRESINNIVAISEETEEIKNLFLLAASDVERGVAEYLIGFQMRKTLLNGENEEGLTKIIEGNKYFLNALNLLKKMMENNFDFFNEEYISHIDASIKYYFSKISD